MLPRPIGTCVFVHTPESHASGGVSVDAQTVPECKAICRGRGLAPGVSCYGFDFDKDQSKCFIFTFSAIKLVPGRNVDHYWKQGLCSPDRQIAEIGIYEYNL